MLRFHAKSEEQLSALLAKLKEDAGLQEKLKGAADLDAAVALAKEAGFNVSRNDFIRYEASKVMAMSDAELEAIAGGRDSFGPLCPDTQGFTCECTKWLCPTGFVWC